MAMLHVARNVAATTLHVAAGVMSGTAKAVDAVARLVRPRPSPAEEVARTYEDRGSVRPRTHVTVAALPPARVPATHVEELAARPASEVVAEVPNLSTDALRDLAEYEQVHRGRKTVLAAIERTAADLAR